MNPQLHMSSSLPPFSSQEHAKQHPCLPPGLPAPHRKRNLGSLALKSSNSYVLWSKDMWLSQMHARFSIVQEALY